MIDFLPIVKDLLAQCVVHDRDYHHRTPEELIVRAEQLIREEEERRRSRETYEQLHE